MRIAARDMHAIAGLWNELAECPAGHTDEMLTHCMTKLTSIVGAANAFWIGATKADTHTAADDTMRGWRPAAVKYLHSNSTRERLTAEVLRRIGAHIVDPQTQAMVARAGTTRAFLRRELVDDDTWERSWIVNEILRPAGVVSRLVGARSLDPVSESYICLDRHDGDRPFTHRERNLLAFFLAGPAGFHRQQILMRVRPDPQLAPRERQVLALLLTDRTEREIARELGLTWRSTHQYVVSILRKLGVRGRVGLMALWLRQADSDER